MTQGIRSNGNIITTGNITASLNIKGSFIESTGNLLVGGISTLTGDVSVNSLANSSSPVTGALTVAGGVGIGGNLFTNAAANIGAGLTVADDITSSGLTSNGTVGITDTTGSTSTSSGALTVAGGVGIAENLWMGGELAVDSITSNAGSGLAISPATGQNLNISASGGGQVNIATGGEVSLGGKVKVALNSYNSDAAAGGAGVITGELYQTSGAGAGLPFNFPGIVMVKL